MNTESYHDTSSLSSINNKLIHRIIAYPKKFGCQNWNRFQFKSWSCIFEAVEKIRNATKKWRNQFFIFEFCLTGKSDGGKFTLRAVTADPISDTNPISQKKKQILSLSKKKQTLSLKKSYKSYLSNISKKCPSWKICKSYLLKEIQTLSNKETNSISWKDKQIQKLSNKETDSFSWKDTIWEKRRNLNLSQNNEQLFFSPSCLSYLSIEMCPWSQEIVVSRPID